MENKVSEKKADIIIPTLGFLSQCRVHSKGFAGGIWVLWDYSRVDVEIVPYSRQAVHILVSFF